MARAGRQTPTMSGRAILKAAIDSAQTTAAELSRKAGRNEAYIQQFLTRGVPKELPERVRNALAAFLRVHPDALREVDTNDPPPKWYAVGSDVQPAHDIVPPSLRAPQTMAQIEVKGVVSAGLAGEAEVNLSSTPLEYIDPPQSLVRVQDLYALFVAGDSMAGIWLPGDIIYVAPNRPLTTGCYVVVEVDNGPGSPPKAYLKQYLGEDAGKLRLRQINPPIDIEINSANVLRKHRVLHWREWVA